MSKDEKNEARDPPPIHCAADVPGDLGADLALEPGLPAVAAAAPPRAGFRGPAPGYGSAVGRPGRPGGPGAAPGFRPAPVLGGGAAGRGPVGRAADPGPARRTRPVRRSG